MPFVYQSGVQITHNLAVPVASPDYGATLLDLGPYDRKFSKELEYHVLWSLWQGQIWAPVFSKLYLL